MNDYYKLLKFRNKAGTPTKKFIDNMSINEYLSCVVDHKGLYRENYNYLNEVYSGSIPDYILNRYKLCPCYDYILENLNTHNSEFFVRKMKEYFPLLKKCIDESVRKYDHIHFVEIRIPYNFWNKYFINKLLSSERFINFVDFFGYFISKIEKDNNFYYVFFDSKYSQDANRKVYDACHGIIYHVTTIENAAKILNNGIRMKSGGREKRYRDFPKRTYFHAFPPYKKSILQNKDYVDQITMFLHDVNQIAILKVDVRNLGINFYEDTAAKRDGFDNAVFAYCNIPKERITVFYEGNISTILSYYLQYGNEN